MQFAKNTNDRDSEALICRTVAIRLIRSSVCKAYLGEKSPVKMLTRVQQQQPRRLRLDDLGQSLRSGTVWLHDSRDVATVGSIRSFGSSMIGQPNRTKGHLRDRSGVSHFTCSDPSGCTPCVNMLCSRSSRCVTCPLVQNEPTWKCPSQRTSHVLSLGLR